MAEIGQLLLPGEDIADKVGEGRRVPFVTYIDPSMRVWIDQEAARRHCSRGQTVRDLILRAMREVDDR